MLKSLLAAAFVFTCTDQAFARQITCDFAGAVGLEYFIDGKQARAPKELYGLYNPSYVKAYLAKGGRVLNVSRHGGHIGGAAPQKMLRIPVNGKVRAFFKFKNRKKAIEAVAGFSDDGINYFVTMEFNLDGKMHAPVWKCV